MNRLGDEYACADGHRNQTERHRQQRTTRLHHYRPCPSTTTGPIRRISHTNPSLRQHPRRTLCQTVLPICYPATGTLNAISCITKPAILSTTATDSVDKVWQGYRADRVTLVIQSGVDGLTGVTVVARGTLIAAVAIALTARSCTEDAGGLVRIAVGGTG